MSPNEKIKSKQSKYYNPFNYWNKPLGKIMITVIGGTIVLLISLAINHLLFPSSKNIPLVQEKIESSRQVTTPKEFPKTTKKHTNIFQQPQIVAPNSVISINQKGGITANTVINANTVNITPQKRRVSPEQLEIILPALKQLCTTKIRIEYAIADEEQKQFAEDIINAFRVAGCAPEIPPPPFRLISTFGKGLSFGVNSNPPYPHGFLLLQKALIKAHIESKWIGLPGIPSDQLTINVGERP